MPRKIQNTTKADLISVALPNHAASYTVISHQFVIDYAYQALATAGFGIIDEEYRCTADGQIAQGVYKLNFNNDPELSMMFAWTNSYNKQVKFKCVIGAYINNTGSVMISGDIGSWVRKHTGSADTETKATIDDYITNAHMYYNQLCSDKAVMETVTLNKRKQAQLLGVLFAEYEILTTEQSSMIRDLMKKPLHIFSNTDSLWAFYNYVTYALQFSHPKTWMEDQRVLHYFIDTVANFAANAPATPVPVLNTPEEDVPVDPLTVIPNQTNILDQIAEIEAEETIPSEISEAMMNAPEVDFATIDPSVVTWFDKVETVDEDGETQVTFKEVEPDVVQYTDPAGNTFEAIDFHNAVTAEEEVIEEEVVAVAPERVKFSVDNTEEAELDFDLNFEDDAEDTSDQFFL
jgi:hypothetical protein